MAPFRLGKNTLAKILSLAAALILWLHVTVGGTFTTNVAVPIRFSGIARGLMIADKVPDHILVQVRGPGKALFAWGLRGLSARAVNSVTVSLEGLSSGKHAVTVHPDQVNLGDESVEPVRIVEYGQFPLTLDLKVQRTVEVAADSLPELKIARDTVVKGPPSVRPRFVTIEGPESIVRTITSAPVAALLSHDVSLTDTVLRAELAENMKPFVTVKPREVEIRFAVEPLSERVLSGIPIRRIQLPRSRYDIEPDSLTVTIRGPESIISRLKPSDITASVTLRSLNDRGETGGEVKPVVIFPKGIITVTLAPQTVRVTPKG